MRYAMYRLPKKNLTVLFKHLAAEMPLYLPVRQEGMGADFTRWQTGTAVDLYTPVTTLSPKQFFLPAVEKLYSTTYRCDIVPADLPNTAFALLGVRACDAAAIGVLDSVFLQDPVDEFYRARRGACYIITLACEALADECFCNMFGIDAQCPAGDVRTRVNDDYLYWQPLTERGEQLTELLSAVLEKVAVANDTPLTPPHDCSESRFLPLQLTDTSSLTLFNHPAWDTLHRTCIACGVCTYLCPTCQCYDVAQRKLAQKCPDDSHDMDAAGYFRCWDACLYPDFTQMAHGNPRPTPKERFRQRFMHKLVYHPQKYGACGCVGCGRCVRNCPVNMNIMRVARALQKSEENHD